MSELPPDSSSPPVSPGRIDVHCHLIPGIDDGCQSVEESLQCVRRLMERGYVGSICTPHVWPEMFPDNTPEQITMWVDLLQRRLRDQGLDYTLWHGGELRIFDGVIPWMQTHGVPTLAASNCVLMDFWDPFWPDAIDQAVDWLLEQGYQPILAHPERTVTQDNYLKHLGRLRRRGVLLQGNFRCFIGEDGPLADRFVRHLMKQGEYDLLALDMHRPDTLDDRLDGLDLAIKEFGKDVIEPLIRDAPRRLLLGETGT